MLLMKNNFRIIKKNTLYFSLFFIGIGIFFCSFLFFGDRVLALSANYDKKDNDSLSISDWNELANDFLAKSGGINGEMSGVLNVSSRVLSGVGNSSDPGDVVSKGVIDGIVAASSGGSVFVNWGRNDCPIGTDELYEGFGFGSGYNDYGGGGKNICIESGPSGPSSTGPSAGLLYPLATNPHPSFYSPSPEINFANAFIKCSVCYNSGSSCYVKFGGDSCSALYGPMYSGYSFGSLASNMYSHLSSKDRVCMNGNFDSASVPATTPANTTAFMYGTKVANNLGLSAYTANKFVRCVVCCN